MKCKNCRNKLFESARYCPECGYPADEKFNVTAEDFLKDTVNKGKTAPPIKFQDINANYAGLQVSNIETAYARAKANGAIPVSDGGIIDFHKGRAALIRDPDVGGYIVLWQPAR